MLNSTFQRIRGSRLGATAMAGIALALIAGGAALGAIPDASGTIHGCLARNGTLRVIDTDAAGSCTRSELALNWNVQGPVGPRGEQGPAGPQGEPTDLSSLYDQIDLLQARVIALESQVDDLTASPTPTVPVDGFNCDDGDPTTVDTYDAVTGTCRHVISDPGQ
jgi:hypothetical protein